MQYDAWLDPLTPKNALLEILSHDLDDRLEFRRVGREVNTTRGGVDHPGLIEPINPL